MIFKDKNGAEEVKIRARIVGEFLKDSRVKAGLTQQELASKLSYSTAQFVSNWERGISLPPLNVLTTLISLCKISSRNLVDVLFEYQQEVLKAQEKRLLHYLKRGRRAS